MSSTNHVELRNVTKQFGSQKAVNQVDLVLKAGESVGMAGHNGAGKSTIMKLILGLITPTKGEVMLLGEPTGSKAGAQRRSQIGYLPETVALHPSLTGIETMDFYAKLKKQPLSKNRELLERVGISQAARAASALTLKVCDNASLWHKPCWASLKFYCLTSRLPALIRLHVKCFTKLCANSMGAVQPYCSAPMHWPSLTATPIASSL